MTFKFLGILFLKCFGFLIGFGMVSAVAFAVPSTQFQELYDYYFPKHSEYVTSSYRKWFDQTVFNPRARNSLAKNERMLHDAIRGDSAAFHAFVHSSNRGGAGEFGETWNYECVLLLLVLGDDQFVNLLAKEDKKTKALVGDAIKYQIDWQKHPFQKTRNIFHVALPEHG